MDAPSGLGNNGRRYTYLPLGSKSHIRLLYLQPATREGDLKASLVEVSLSQAGECGYEAPSYTWGASRISGQLHIGDDFLPITENLVDTLTSLARHEIRVLWVDAVCINQEVMQEKAEQIPLMTQIYEGAQSVPIYLGPLTGDITVAFGWIPHIAEDLRGIVEKEANLLERAKQFSRLLENQNESRAVTEIFEREWFGRLWVVQEVFVAKKAQFVRGSLELPYQILVDFVFLLNSDRKVHLCITSPRAREGFWNLIKLHSLKNPIYRERYLDDSGKLDIINLMAQTSSRGCSDSRDRLFALAGIASDPNALPYRANYPKTPVAVYTDFAIHDIGHSHSMRVLVYCYLSPKRMTGLSSWVPDWDHATPILLSKPTIPGSLPLFHSSGRKSYKNQILDIKTDEKPPKLTLMATIVDTVDVVWPGPFKVQRSSPGENPSPDNYGHIGCWLDQLLLFGGPFSEHQIPWSVMWRVLIMDISIVNKSKTRAVAADERHVEARIDVIIHLWQEDQWEKNQNRRRSNENVENKDIEGGQPVYGQALKNFKLRWDLTRLSQNKLAELEEIRKTKAGMNWADLKSAGKSLRSRLGLSNREKNPASSADTQYATSVSAANMFSIVQQRIFCITASGRCGWVPDVSVSKDVVAIFAGCDVPMILRPCESGNYQLVGEAYIHGIMDGESIHRAKLFEPIRLI